MSKTQTYIRLMRERCLKDPLFLGRVVLGYELLEEDVYVMRELAKQAKHLGDTITLIPRSMCKSTVVTVVGAIWYNLNFPQDCTLITSNTDVNAQKFLAEIVGHYKTNEKFRMLFPEFCPKDEKGWGTLSAFRCPNQKAGRKEATFEATGMNSTVTSRHYEKIIIDDVVYRENVCPQVTPATMAKTYEYIRSLTALMKLTSNRCYRHIVGTRWHDGDAYGDILGDPDYSHFRRLILSPFHEDGSSIWPEVFPLEKLERLCGELKPYLWACLMMQDPMPPESAASFQEEWLHQYEDPGSLPEDTRVAITIDPAFSKDWKADRSAITVTGIPKNRRLYVMRCRAARLTPHQIARTAFDFYFWAVELGFTPEYIGVESDAGGEAIYNVLRELKAEYEYHMRVVKLKSGQNAKPSRIAELSGYAETYGIYTLKNMGSVRHHILRYPVGKEDDILDSLAHRVRKLSKAHKKGKPKVEEEAQAVITIQPRTAEMMIERRFKKRKKTMDIMRVM